MSNPRPLHVLGVFPHPDDEAYAAGAALAEASDAGARVTIASATRGEAGRDRTGEVQPGDALGERRVAELNAACRALGASPPIVWGFADGRLSASDPALIDRLRGLVADVRPDVVVTLGRDGVYGHPDHLALTAALIDVLDDHPETRLLLAAFPRGTFARVHAGLRRFGVAVGAPETLGVAERAVAVRVPVGPHRATKLAAIAAHRSQLRAGDPLSFLSPGLVETLLHEEWFELAGGPPPPPGATSLVAGLGAP